jgi:hypothetical protein
MRTLSSAYDSDYYREEEAPGFSFRIVFFFFSLGFKCQEFRVYNL